MGRPSLQNVMSNPDALQTWNWAVTFPRIPGSGDTRPLSYRAVSTTVPSQGVEQVTQDYPGGVTLAFAGKPTWTRTWTCTFVEARDMLSRSTFLNWKNFARNLKTNTGNYKSAYAVPVELELFDDAPKAVQRILLVNTFVTEVGEISLDTSSGIVQLQVTFSFDISEETTL